MYKKTFKQRFREGTSLVLALSLHGVFVYALQFLQVYYFEDEPMQEYGMEVSYGEDWQGTDAEAIPVESVSEEDLADIIPSDAQIAEEESENIANDNQSDIQMPDKDDKKQNQQTEDKDDKTDKTKANKDPKKDNTQNNNKEQGKYTNKDGKQGKDVGTEGNNNLYTPGGTGASLDMTGWAWENPPSVKDNSNETGKIIFEVLVSAEGDILDVLPIESTVSPSLERIYKEKVYQIRFFKTDTNAKTQTLNKGRITFIITAR